MAEQFAFPETTLDRIVNVGVTTKGPEFADILQATGARELVTLDVFLPNIYASLAAAGVRHLILHSVSGVEQKLPPLAVTPLPLEQLLRSQPACEPRAVSGPQVMEGYWQTPEAMESTARLKGGWLFTGDLARMDADGYFFIVERREDMIITSGFNVYPSEIEAALKAHPRVADAAGKPLRRELRKAAE